MTKAPDADVIPFPVPGKSVAEGGAYLPSVAFPHVGDRLEGIALMAAVGLKRFSRFRGDAAEEIKAAHFLLTQATYLYASLTSLERTQRATNEALKRLAAPPAGPDAA